MTPFVHVFLLPCCKRQVQVATGEHAHCSCETSPGVIYNCYWVDTFHRLQHDIPWPSCRRPW
jgi:hypothetical protein